MAATHSDDSRLRSSALPGWPFHLRFTTGARIEEERGGLGEGGGEGKRPTLNPVGTSSVLFRHLDVLSGGQALSKSSLVCACTPSTAALSLLSFVSLVDHNKCGSDSERRCSPPPHPRRLLSRGWPLLIFSVVCLFVCDLRVPTRTCVVSLVWLDSLACWLKYRRVMGCCSFSLQPLANFGVFLTVMMKALAAAR